MKLFEFLLKYFQSKRMGQGKHDNLDSNQYVDSYLVSKLYDLLSTQETSKEEIATHFLRIEQHVKAVVREIKTADSFEEARPFLERLDSLNGHLLGCCMKYLASYEVPSFLWDLNGAIDMFHFEDERLKIYGAIKNGELG